MEEILNRKRAKQMKWLIGNNSSRLALRCFISWWFFGLCYGFVSSTRLNLSGWCWFSQQPTCWQKLTCRKSIRDTILYVISHWKIIYPFQIRRLSQSNCNMKNIQLIHGGTFEHNTKWSSLRYWHVFPNELNSQHQSLLT